ncbi:hypothetical protein [Hymenobacter terrenus]|uniref:hypothetical protein n=1 Tax=Hymenobacter terrenus TaxID=1629124 RepID=UPI000AB6C558|nr:hypothetical protein [Hymenobacter terrenus]
MPTPGSWTTSRGRRVLPSAPAPNPRPRGIGGRDNSLLGHDGVHGRIIAPSGAENKRARLGLGE